ncbi:hypothetical protein [Saccharomonospora piscinae]|uniref:hypothetical protein n=1 Tax=Saccharomonospora piscinae TaxID=687388 RepID=UPI00110698AF|nr:hypothetical protein [Saccharomonospora piscinae]TLW91048.1 hypothetical protein FFT09_17390 [Saccharomonospora piscinae]
MAWVRARVEELARRSQPPSASTLGRRQPRWVRSSGRRRASAPPGDVGDSTAATRVADRRD